MKSLASNTASVSTDTDFLEYAVNLGKQLERQQNAHTTERIEGVTYVFHNGTVSSYKQVDPPSPERYDAFSLQGLVDFIQKDVDRVFQDPKLRHIVRVVSPSSVDVLTPICGVGNKRNVIARCSSEASRIPFNQFLDAEDFVIMIQTRFVQSPPRDTVLSLVANLRDEQSMQTADDGFSQRVTVKKGVASVGDVVVKNPVPLTPIRIFSEVEQPESPFVLRFQEGSQVALFEADGGAWKINAVETIRDWLREKLSDCNVEVIA